MKSGFPIGRLALVALRVASLIAIALPLSPVCAAQEQAGTARLAAVQVTGSKRFTSDQIVTAIGLHAGSQVGRDDLQRAADGLAKTGRFSSVQYRFATTDDGVHAEYEVTDAPDVPVWFDNFPWLTDDELIAALKKSIPLFDGTAPEGGAILDEISDEVQSQLRARGVNGTVSHVLTTVPGTDEHVQQFRTENAVLNIASVEFGDALAQSDRGVQSRLSDIVGEKYSRAAVVLFEFEQVRPVYLSHGFLRVKFGPPSARVVDTGGVSRVAIVAPVEPGPAFTWRPPTWTGSSIFGVLELATLVPLHEGDVADGMKIEHGWEAIRDAYARRGYLDADLVATPHFDDSAKTITYVVSITEGPQFRMGKLVLTGLSLEGEKRIRAAWRIPPGVVFDRGVYEEFITSGIKEAFSGLPFHYDKIGRFLQEDPKNATVDVLLDFQ
jgi:outer membrane protein assembly factor BamA